MTDRSNATRAAGRVTVLAGAAFWMLTAAPTLAQVPYQIGDGNPNVTVDLGVLNQLGPGTNVPGLLNRVLRGGYVAPGYAAQTGAAGAPGSAVIGNAPNIPGWLRRDGAGYAPLPGAQPTYAAPPVPATAAAPSVTLRPPQQRAQTATAPATTTRAATSSSVPAPSVPAPRVPAPSVPETTTPATAPSAGSQSASTPPPPPAIPQAPEPPRVAQAPAETTGTQAAATPPAPTPPAPTPPAPSAPAPPAATPTPPAPAVPAPAAPAAQTPPPAPVVPAPSQVASAPASTAPAAPAPAPSDQGAETSQVIFPAGQSQLPDAGKAALAPIIERLTGDNTLRLQLKAYAGGGQDSANTARRWSLSRALAVRAYLIDNGVQSTRMDVRALGDRSGSGPADRVDVVVVSR